MKMKTYIASELLGFDARRTRLGTINDSSLEKVSHGVEGHVDGTVGKGLNEVLGIPW